jgi:diacylglycerol kinase family enzyme
VVNALVGKGKKRPRATLGVLPLGTANDFAHGCGLPVKDLKRCLEIACTARAKKTDVGRANSSSFIKIIMATSLMQAFSALFKLIPPREKSFANLPAY